MRLWLARSLLSPKILLHSGQLWILSSGSASISCCIRECRFNCDGDPNCAPHTVHLCGRSPVCVRICATSWWLYTNAFVHSAHLNCGSMVWNFSCDRRCVWCVKRRGHWLHEYGLMLLWTLACATHCDFRRNSREQISHLNGFSPVWTRLCKVKLMA